MARAAQQHVAAVRQAIRDSASARPTTFGMRPRISTFMLSGTRLSSSVSLNRLSISSAGSTDARARLEDEAHVLGRLVAHVGKQRQLLLVDQFGDPLDQPHFLHLPGNFGDHDQIGAAAGLFGLPARAHAERAAAGGVGLGDGRRRIDDEAAGREIRTRHVFEQRFRARVRLLDEIKRGVAQLGDIVRRNRRRHADRDALRAVGQQIRKRRRQDHRLLHRRRRSSDRKSTASSSMPSSNSRATSVKRASV